jgi:hypothetical protein
MTPQFLRTAKLVVLRPTPQLYSRLKTVFTGLDPVPDAPEIWKQFCVGIAIDADVDEGTTEETEEEAAELTEGS